MRVEDITVEIRSDALGLIGQIDLDLVDDLKLIKRYCNVGSWTLSLPAEYDKAQLLRANGRGIVVRGKADKLLMSGSVLTWDKVETAEDPIGMYMFTGVDDNIHLSDALAWPEPGNANPNTQTVSHDVRTGPAETVIRNYFRYNIVPGTATADRAVAGLATQPDLGRGAIVTGRARFPKLGEIMSELAMIGGIGFDMTQIGTAIQLAVYVPSDKTADVRMDIDNDLLQSTRYGFSAPTSTRQIVAGQGEGADRKILKVVTTESTASETAWRRKIETFKDRRDTDVDAELIQEGTAALEAEGKTVTSLSVVPTDDTMEYADQWYLGDRVTVVVDGEELSAIVTEAIISISPEGIKVAATIGEPVGFDFESKIIANQQTQESKIAWLERNAEQTDLAPVVAQLNADIDALELALAVQQAKELWRGPNRPLFAARGTTALTKGSTASTVIVPMNTALINQGGYYNTSTYKFKAPVAGNYEFTLTGAASTVNGGPELQLFKNNVVFVPNVAIGYGVAYNTFSGTVIVSLALNDEIDMRLTNNNDVSVTLQTARCLFVGKLID